LTPEWKTAVTHGAVGELQRLLLAGVDVNARDEHGQTGLMIAAKAGHKSVVEWLIGQRANLNHTAKYGLSALMLAVVNGHVSVVRLLVRAGANHELRGTGAPGFAGKTALDLAIARDGSEIVEILHDRAGDAD
jgi:ankyrin repeat protein